MNSSRGTTAHPGISPRRRQGTISVIVAVRNEEAALPEFYTRLVRALGEIGLAWELILVEDSSTDRTVEVIRELGQRDARVKAIFLTAASGITWRLLQGSIMQVAIILF